MTKNYDSLNKASITSLNWSIEENRNNYESTILTHYSYGCEMSQSEGG